LQMSSSMSTPIISISSLSKQYHIGAREKINRNLREAITEAFTAPIRNFREIGRLTRQDDHADTIWALKDVTFDVQEGEVVGIIGRNGAGKSTLLKILSRITEPTSGEIRLNGRVSSLLEVGTGFHPELTGRENIYLNGTILGMRKVEIDRKFEEIVAFSEIEKFLDTPVKRYSSGMYVRLAFAVAAHLEPEILLVDEVLAVGDAAFQKKCLGKMGDVAKEGRTILFVSHNLAAVLSLCSRSFLLDQGALISSGPTEDVVNRYLQESKTKAEIPLDQRNDRKGNGTVRVTSFSLTSAQGNPSITSGDSLRISIGYSARKPPSGLNFLVGIYDQLNRPIFFLDSRTAGGIPTSLEPTGNVSCLTGPINITPGPCIVNVALVVNEEIVDHIGSITSFDVEPADFYGTGRITNRQTSLCLLQQMWEVIE
jgi:lipopolysaccharide transport system ATP-binding protein